MRIQAKLHRNRTQGNADDSPHPVHPVQKRGGDVAVDIFSNLYIYLYLFAIAVAFELIPKQPEINKKERGTFKKTNKRRKRDVIHSARAKGAGWSLVGSPAKIILPIFAFQLRSDSFCYHQKELFSVGGAYSYAGSSGRSPRGSVGVRLALLQALLG